MVKICNWVVQTMSLHLQEQPTFALLDAIQISKWVPINYKVKSEW